MADELRHQQATHALLLMVIGFSPQAAYEAAYGRPFNSNVPASVSTSNVSNSANPSELSDPLQGNNNAQAFRMLWENHPLRFGISLLIADRDQNGELVYANQCAIRLTFALRAVPTFSRLFDRTFNGLADRGFALRAADLAAWLPTLLGRPQVISGDNKLEQVTNRTGILFLGGFRGTTDLERTFNHIDLWNRGTFAQGDFNWINRAKRVLFWEFGQ
jgi:hypothetical protein